MFELFCWVACSRFHPRLQGLSRLLQPMGGFIPGLLARLGGQGQRVAAPEELAARQSSPAGQAGDPVALRSTMRPAVSPLLACLVNRPSWIFLRVPLGCHCHSKSRSRRCNSRLALEARAAVAGRIAAGAMPRSCLQLQISKDPAQPAGDLWRLPCFVLRSPVAREPEAPPDSDPS